MQISQILHFSGDILKFYFIPEQFVPNVINLSGPDRFYLVTISKDLSNTLGRFTGKQPT